MEDFICTDQRSSNADEDQTSSSKAAAPYSSRNISTAKEALREHSVRPIFQRYQQPTWSASTSPSRVDSFSDASSLYVSRLSRASSEPNEAHARPSTGACGHCQAVKSRNDDHHRFLGQLVSHCRELENIIRQRYHSDNCICYPSYITEAEALRPSEFPHLHVPSSLHSEFFQHLLRLVRPGVSEHEVRGSSSRVVRHSAETSKVLIPVTVSCGSNNVLFIGYPRCFSGRPAPAQPTHRTIELVIDYDPPVNLLPYTSHGRRQSRQSSRELFPCTSTPPTGHPVAPTRAPMPVETPGHSSLRASHCNVAPIGTVPIRVHHFEFPPRPVSFQQTALHLRVGHFEVRGRRSKMEDRTVATLDLHSFAGVPPLAPLERVSFFAIYDGHGGIEVVDFVAKSFHKTFCQTDSYKRDDIPAALLQAFEITERQIGGGLRKYLEVWRRFRHYRESLGLPISADVTSLSNERSNEAKAQWSDEEPVSFGMGEMETKMLDLRETYGIIGGEKEFADDESLLTSGSTALVVLIKENWLYLANLGDSRCILCRGGRIACLTEDHRLRSSARETERVKQTPGTYSYDGYLCGQLSVSRAFGNVHKKSGKKLLGQFSLQEASCALSVGLSSSPDVLQLQITPEDEFMIIACDGLFDVVTAADAVVTVRAALKSTNCPTAAARQLVELALLSHSDDNISVIVVGFGLAQSTSPDHRHLIPVASAPLLFRSEQSDASHVAQVKFDASRCLYVPMKQNRPPQFAPMAEDVPENESAHQNDSCWTKQLRGQNCCSLCTCSSTVPTAPLRRRPK